MSKQTLVDEYLEWSKQKLGEIETTLASLDGSVETLKHDARTEADRAIARIRTARDAFKAKVDAVRSDAAATKTIPDDAYERQSWQSSLQAIRATALAAIDHASSEADTAIRRLAAETEKAEAKLGKVSAVGDESWKAIKNGLDEAISVYDRTWKKISEAVSKI
jgi:hypothetical protein